MKTKAFSILLNFLFIWNIETLTSVKRPCQPRKMNCITITSKKMHGQNFTEKDIKAQKKDIKHVKCLQVRDAKIRFIEKALFSKLVNLSELCLTNLSMEENTIKDGLLNINKTKLSQLSLDNVGLDSSILEDLHLFLPKSLEHLVLRNNVISFFSTDYISKTDTQILDLSFNINLSLIMNRTIPSLTHLILSYSGFRWNTTFQINGTCVFPNLSVLHLEGNEVNLSAVDIKNNCFAKIISLYLNRCRFIVPINSESFSFFPNLEHLYMNGITNMVQLPTFSNTKNLLTLSINDVVNNFFQPSTDNMKCFQNLKNLQYLEMRKWNMTSWKSDQLCVLFTPVANTLKKMDLTSTGLGSIPRIISQMNNLKTLKLNNNRISKLDYMSKQTNKNLTTLWLPYNLIELVDPNSIPPSVTNFNLKGNPFRCTCELMPYKNWILERKLQKIVQDWQTSYHCFEPLDWKGKSLDEFKPKVTDCQPFNQYVITAIVLCCLMVVVVITTNVYVKLRKSHRKGRSLKSYGACEEQKLLETS
ncbi:toll-like receptor 3 [Saccostrea cucullata]|uniref:toll-like receptor 3 n=1 Tax=Saccostrea cuccullata TaxID=36930 RepID=UPI002ED37C24